MDERNFTAAPSFGDKLKALDWKKILIVVAALAVVAVLVIVLLSLGNSKTAPIGTMQKYANAKSIKMENYYKDLLSGADGGNAAKIVKLLKKSDEFKEDFEEMEENFADSYEDNADEYGKNFKIAYKSDKSVEEKIDRDDLKDYKASIKSMGEDFAELGKTLGKLKSSDLKDLAEDLDLSTSDAKELIDCLKDLGQKLKGADVTEGYDMEILTKITGSELDDPDEDDFDLTVLKVNGKWVAYPALNSLYSLYYMVHNAVGSYL